MSAREAKPRLTAPDPSLRRVVAALRHGGQSREFADVVAALTRDRDHYRDLCRAQIDPAYFHRAQGAWQVLEDILRVLQEASE